MAAFVTRTLDQSLKRGSRRAALDQWWTANDTSWMTKRGFISGSSGFAKSDGKHLWAIDSSGLKRIDPADDTETLYGGMNSVTAVLIAMGRVFATGNINGSYVLYQVDPTLVPGSPGSVTVVATGLGSQPRSLAFDGKKIWTANQGSSVSLIDPANNFSVTTRPLGIQPSGILFDGGNIWVTDGGNGNLIKMDAFGFVVQTVVLGGDAGFPTFDGTNIWVPDQSTGKVNVVRASTGAQMATLQLNGAHNFLAAAFDGERVAVTDLSGYVQLWRATDLTHLESVQIDDPRTPLGICSDGTRFWVSMRSDNNGGYLLSF
jgi:YVTN family beta-propeller protein